MEYKDYYQILGITKDASQDDIKKAYRSMARKYHPDVSKEADAQKRMAEVNEANTVLSDPEKRAAYDQLGDPGQYQGSAGFSPPPGWNADSHHFRRDNAGESFHAGDYSSFFENLFGGERQFRQQQAQRNARGQDQHASIELTVPESYSGATRMLRMRGVELDANGHAVEKTRELHVTIPKGVHEGQLIRLAGKGQPGIGNGQAGDLLLEVRFAEDTRWHTEGKNVYQQLPLTAWEAALGGPVEFQTLAGTLEINIPAGSQPGRKLRVKGKGLPASQPGDLYLVVQLAVPAPVTDAQRSAYEELAKSFPHFNPRSGAQT